MQRRVVGRTDILWPRIAMVGAWALGSPVFGTVLVEVLKKETQRLEVCDQPLNFLGVDAGRSPVIEVRGSRMRGSCKSRSARHPRARAATAYI